MTEPANVIAALAAVTGELGGIEKMTPEERRRKGLGGGDEQGVKYAYRGVDQIAAAAAPLFGKYGVVIVPDVTEQDVAQLTINNKPWTDTSVEVEWSVYGPGGLNDKLVARTRGLGRDNSDKGPNKALTAAYKNLLLRLLCIGDPADDGDGHAPEADVRPMGVSCPKCSAFVEGDPEDRETLRPHLIAEHGFVRLDDGSVVSPDKVAAPSPVVENVGLSEGAEEGEGVQASDTVPAPSAEVTVDGARNIQNRIDALPDELRHACEDACTLGTDGRWPNEPADDDIPELSKLVSEFEAEAAGEPPSTGPAAARAALAGRR